MSTAEEKTVGAGAESQEFNESMVVEVYQLAVLTPGNGRLHMTLWGHPESATQRANYAEIEFVEDGLQVPEPRFTPNLAPGVHRIGIWFSRWQFAHIADILRQSTGVRCFYFQPAGKSPYAGIKDWNYKKTPVTHSPSENEDMSLVLREQATSVDTNNARREMGKGLTSQ